MSTPTDFAIRVLVDVSGDAWVPAGTATGEALNMLDGPTYGENKRAMLDGVGGNPPVAESLVQGNPFTSDYGLLTFSPVGTVDRFLAMGGSVAAAGDPFYGITSITPGSAYTLTAWFQTGGTADGTVNHRWHVASYDSGGTFWDSQVSDYWTHTAEWAQQSLTFTAGTPCDYGLLIVEREQNKPYEDYKLAGWMLTAGTAVPTQYNTGNPLEAYEDITEFVVAADWDLGRSDPPDALCYDGQLRLTLNNDDKRFSPAYTGGPLYGRLLPGNRAFIRLWDGNEWTVLFSGFVTGYGVTSGTRRARQATFTVKQGMERWSKDFVSGTDYDTAAAGELIAEVFDKRGWQSPESTLSWVLGQSRLGVDTYLRSGTAAFNTLDTGGTYTQLQQTGRAGEMSVQKALRVISEDEAGEFWCGRDGRLNYRERAWFASAAVTGGTLEAGDTFTGGRYDYGRDVISRAIVRYDQYTGYARIANYEPNNKSTNIILAAGGTAQWGFTVPYETYTPVGFEVTDTVLDRDELYSLSCYDPAKSWVGGFVHPDDVGDPCGSHFGLWTATADGDSLTVQVVNNANLPFVGPISAESRIWDISVLVDSFDQTIYSASADGTVAYPHTSVWQYTARLMTTEAQAAAYADHFITGLSAPRGQFSTVQFTAGKNSGGPLPADHIARARDWTLGVLCAVSDTQAGESAETHTVIGERHRYTPGVLESEYLLRNVENWRD